MKRYVRLIACLAAAALTASCAAYKFGEMDGQALAGKGKKSEILSVDTLAGSFNFSADDPARVKNGAVVGNQHMSFTLDPLGIVEITPEGKIPKVVMKDGSRFKITSTRPEGEMFKCEGVKTVCIPLDEVVYAKVRTEDTAGSIFGTLAGVALLVGVAALDSAIYDEDPVETFTADLFDALSELGRSPSSEPGGRRSNEALLRIKDASDIAVEKEFWTMEWTPVDARPGDDGKMHVRLDNTSGVPRGVDDAKLVVVDHPPGFAVAPDILGFMRAYSGPLAPETATEGKGKDIREPLAARDGVLWRTAGGEPAAGAAPPVRDEISVSFPRPKGARSAKLIVGASNSTWRAEFAREVLARNVPASPDNKVKTDAGNKSPKPPSVYQNWEYSTLRVRLLTISGWQTGQAIFATGPLPAEDMIYDLDLSDVATDRVSLKLSPPAGYWLIDRLAIDFGQDVTVETTEVAAEDVDGPDPAEVLKALAVEDATTFVLDVFDAPAQLTFTAPLPKEGLERAVFLRTVSCYEMPANLKDTQNRAPRTGH